jgi:hypothetical protein|tara:strand:+ start:671 stop:934 length:264 start_codon:yes stop_codon:yes gene_type:complete
MVEDIPIVFFETGHLNMRAGGNVNLTVGGRFGRFPENAEHAFSGLPPTRAAADTIFKGAHLRPSGVRFTAETAGRGSLANSVVRVPR